MSTGTDLIPAGTAAAVDDIQQQVAQAKAQAEAIEVRDEASAAIATTLLREIQKRRKVAEAKRREYVDPLNASVKKINADFKTAMAPFEAADEIVRKKVQAWTTEQERIRREDEERLERERQERERKTREERERQEAEARAKREQAEKEEREAAELQRAAKDKEDAEAAERLAEEARQRAEEAATAESAISSLPDVQLPKAVVLAAPKQEGVSTRKRWAVKSMVGAQMPREYLIPDEARIKAELRAHIKQNGKPPEIPGVEFEQVDELAVRA